LCKGDGSYLLPPAHTTAKAWQRATLAQAFAISPTGAFEATKSKDNQMRKSSKKTKAANPVGHSGGPEGPTGTFWTQSIRPKSAALISETLGPVYFVIKNLAPHTIKLVAKHGDLMDLVSGAVRATYAHGMIRVENPDEKSSALIAFNFLPIFRR
jgi:hypothetical protein